MQDSRCRHLAVLEANDVHDVLRGRREAGKVRMELLGYEVKTEIGGEILATRFVDEESAIEFAEATECGQEIQIVKIVRYTSCELNQVEDRSQALSNQIECLLAQPVIDRPRVDALLAELDQNNGVIRRFIRRFGSRQST